jgi:hypothetical protein
MLVQKLLKPWEKQEKATTYNVVIVPMKNPCGENRETKIILHSHCLIKTYCEKICKAKLT